MSQMHIMYTMDVPSVKLLLSLLGLQSMRPLETLVSCSFHMCSVLFYMYLYLLPMLCWYHFLLAAAFSVSIHCTPLCLLRLVVMPAHVSVQPD